MKRHSHLRRMVKRVVLAIVVCGIVVALVNWSSYYHRGIYHCPLCGAQMRLRCTRLLGIEFDLERRVIEGPVSRLIQEHDGVRCSHKWQYATGISGRLFFEASELARGMRGHDFVSSLEDYECSQAFLKHKAETDPEFAAKVKWVLEDPSETEREACRVHLIEQLWQFEEDGEKRSVDGEQQQR